MLACVTQYQVCNEAVFKEHVGDRTGSLWTNGVEGQVQLGDVRIYDERYLLIIIYYCRMAEIILQTNFV